MGTTSFAWAMADQLRVMKFDLTDVYIMLERSACLS